MSFNVIRENIILAKISGFTVHVANRLACAPIEDLDQVAHPRAMRSGHFTGQ